MISHGSFEPRYCEATRSFCGKTEHRQSMPPQSPTCITLDHPVSAVQLTATTDL